MRKHLFDGRQWESQEGKRGKDADHLIRLDGEHGRLELEVRAADPVQLYGVTPEGELVFLDSGSRVVFSELVTGLAGVTVSSKGPFSYRAFFSKRGENIDPTRLTVDDTFSAEAAERLMVREELRALLNRSGLLAEHGIAVDDVLEDLDEDLGFEEDPDELGEGFMVGLEPVEEPPVGGRGGFAPTPSAA